MPIAGIVKIDSYAHFSPIHVSITFIKEFVVRSNEVCEVAFYKRDKKMSILSFSKKHTASEDTYVFLECEERDGKYTAGQKIAVSVDDLPQNLDLEKWGFTVNQRTRNNQQRFRYTLVKTPLPSQRQE